ncbi:hypothetical protein AB0I53_32345 [Saccharopolyspora sp. NPDC050389]|uniref:hypothetical protein n=1 Tax=Saccharopolyspora sp. NPDC050389 TaxID=3155516 RepID=UPI0033C27597
MSTVHSGHRLPPWGYVAAGTAVILATYLYLLVERPSSLHESGHGSSAALIALGGYLIGSLLVIAGASALLPTSTVAMLPVAIAINVVIGQLVNMLGLPVYLDSIGTVIVGALAGPAAGAATGALSNIIWGLTISPPLLPFSVAAAAIGVLAGLVARIGAFRRLWTALPGGLLAGVVAGMLSAPIAAFVFGGGGSPGRTALQATFQAFGNSLLDAATLTGLATDPLDKVVTFAIAFLILAALPARFRERSPFVRRYAVFGRRTAVLEGLTR